MNSFEIRIPFSRNNSWSFRSLLTSDRHIDHPHSDWELQKHHLDEARRTGSVVLDAGDLFCAMQSKSDRRGNKSSVPAELARSNYIDLLVESTAEKLAPWAHLMPVILSGNHEETVLEKLETSLSERLCERLRALRGATCYHAGYGASISFRFYDKQQEETINLWMEHGAGGGGAVTGGLIDLYRKATYLPDWDIIACGHTHDKDLRWLARLRRAQNGRLFEEEHLLLKLCTYKREYQYGRGGWHTRRGARPKPVGAWWLNFRWDRRTQHVVFEPTRA